MPNERRKNARLSAKEANRVLSILEGLPTLRASPHFPHEWPSPPGPPSLPYDLEPSAPSDPPHSMMFSEPPPPSNPPDPVFALLSLPSFISRVRPPTRSSFFPTVCRISHGVLSARACLASGASLIRHCHTPNFVVDHPRARHSALTQPHRTSRTPLRSAYPFDKVHFFPEIHVGDLCFESLRNL